MRLFLKKKTPDRIEFGIIYGGIALLILGAGRLLPVLAFAPDCVFKRLTTIPCPSCGSTRSVVHLSHGDFLSAFVMNPLITLCMVAAVMYFFICLLSAFIDLPRISFLLTETEKNGVRVGAVALILVQWAYLIISR